MANKKRAPVELVDPKEIMGLPEIRREKIQPSDLPQGDTLFVMQWLAKRRLLKNSQECGACHIPMSRRRRVGMDGFVWRCRLCDAHISIRKGSLFEHSHLKLSQTLVLLHGWSRGLPQKEVAELAKVNQSRTIVDWFNFCRNVCIRYFKLHDLLVGGFNEDGSSKVVEIGEAHISRGGTRPGRWVLGGIERGSNKCFLVEVTDRSPETISVLIVQKILPGTRIISEDKRLFKDIGTLSNSVYDHQLIPSAKSFADACDPDVHKRNIEDMWMRAKRKLARQFGTSEDLFPSYLSEFEWRNQLQDESNFSELLICFIIQYPI